MAKLNDLLKDAGLSEDEIAAAESAFTLNPKIASTLEAATLRQSDYSRGMDSLAKKTKELETSWSKANEEYVKMQTSLTSTQAERDEAARRLSEAETKLATQPAIDATKFMTPEQVQDQLRSFAAGQTAYFGDVLQIADDHHQLFGSRLSAKELIQQALEAKKTPTDFWNEKYNVSAKRTELAEKEKADLEARIREDERKKVHAEFLNPASRPLTESQRPFYDVEADAKQPWEDTTPTAAENNLVAALANAGR